MFYLFKEHKWEGSREQFRTFIPKHLQFAFFFLFQKTEQINRVRDICTLNKVQMSGSIWAAYS